MLAINFIRENKKLVEEACRNKNLDASVVEQLLAADKKRRKLIVEIEKIKAAKNKFEASIKEKPSSQILKKAKKFKEKLNKLEPHLKEAEANYWELLHKIPNLPADDVPVGKDETANAIVKKWGELPRFDFIPKDHLALGEALDLIDVKRAAKLSGSRFGYLKNEAVLLEFALIQLALEILQKNFFIPIIPPQLINLEITKGLGYWEAGGSENYYQTENFYLIGTAEHALVPLHQNEVLNEEDLPQRYVGFSSAFRKESGSYGKDTRGIFRVHEFDKVEMVSLVKPENSNQEHEKLLSLAEKMVQVLELPYRVVKICTGDLSFPAAKAYDIECWFPGQERYRETHSISNCTDFQARRFNIKYQARKSGKREFVHILNGTAFAIGRMLIALMENNQTKEGWIKVPKVLRNYVGREIIKR